ncbi:TIGR02281 family clan AA aspartic protease [Ensifer sp.]|uniref:retropepsin-like aspartic protease family protein n=1 Tax=Ensifer sp. TaxID=1872086 RepID=UPI000DD65633|nr:TIGR02281 family clan AA aspartic protease [Ensifer sp.]
MFGRLLTFAGGIAVAALVVPDLASSYLSRPDAPDTGKAAANRSTPASTAKYASGRTIVLQADRSGHFFGDFRINGRTQSGLVDTGASTIAINVSTARRLGLSTGTLSFDVRVGTANGEVEAARAKLNRVEIGGISLRDVDALVLPDKSLSGMLVGMSFLRRLSSYRVEDGAMHLVR